MNGYQYPQQQQSQQAQQLPTQPSSGMSGGINPSMLQGGGPSGTQGHMNNVNQAAMLARQQNLMGLGGGSGMGMGMGGMSTMNNMNGMGSMGGMPGMNNNMANINGMNSMGGMGGMNIMNGMGGMGSGGMNMPGRMGNNMELMNNFKAGSGGGGLGNGMGFENSMSMNPGMMNSGMGNAGAAGMGMGGAMSQQDLQKMIAQRQMNMGGMNNMGGMPGMGMGGMGGMNMSNQNSMNGMGQNMNAIGMGGMMGGNNSNMLAMQIQQQMQSQGQQQSHTPNQMHAQSPHASLTPSSNPYPPFPAQNQNGPMPPPPRPNTAMSSSSHSAPSQHPGPPPGMGMNHGAVAGIPRPPTAAGQHQNQMHQPNAQFQGTHSVGHQISRPGTASGHHPHSAGVEPPRTPLLGQQVHAPQGPHIREMSRPPSRPHTSNSNAGGSVAPHTPIQAHSPGAMRPSISQGQMNGMQMPAGPNAMNIMGGVSPMNGKFPPGSGGMGPNAMGGANPGMMMPPSMSRQPSLSGGQQSPVHSTHSQRPQTPQGHMQHHQGMMAGPSTPTPMSGRMRAMSGTEGPDSGLGGMGSNMGVGGIPNADASSSGQPNMNVPGGMPGMGMPNNMMQGMGMGAMGNMGAMNNGLLGMNPQQIQFQELQRKNELAKQQQAIRMQQQQNQMQVAPSTPVGMGTGPMPSVQGGIDAPGLGIAITPNQAPGTGMPGMPNMGANQQMPIGTPTRPSAAPAQMPGVQSSPAGIAGMPVTPSRPSVPPGLGGQVPSLPAGTAVPQVNGAAPTPAPNQNQPTELPPLPAHIQLNPATTRITAVPIAEAAEKIPPLSEEAIIKIKEWREADKAYEARFRAMNLRFKEELTHGPMGVKPRWWERDPNPSNAAALARRRPPEKFDLSYHNNLAQNPVQRKRVKRREGLRIPGRLKAADAERGEQLVPIRLEFDVEHHKYRDTFVWNLNDPIVTPEAFATSIIDDYGLPQNYHSTITKSIEEQLSDHKLHSATLEEITIDNEVAQPPAPETIGAPVCGLLNPEDELWWAKWRSGLRDKDGRVRTKALLKQGLERDVKMRGKKRRREPSGSAMSEAASEALSMIESSTHDLEMPEYDENMHEEMRIVIKLDITVGEMQLDDQFEWDIENADPTPEQFAEIYSSDLGLAGEFKTAIAHSIREQVNTYQKSLFLVGHPSDGSAIQDDDLRMSFLSQVTSVTRTSEQTQQHQPVINYYSEGELDRLEKEREKEANRRRKRNTRGRRGVTLPDREPQKTHRTPAIGFPEIDPQILALAQAASAPTSRRAAAAAASVTIANMVASENGTAFIPTSTTPSAPSMPASKIPKAKGSFKAPNYPSSLIKSRAELKTPTQSTAANSSTYEPPIEGDAPLPASLIPSAPEPRPSRALTAKRQRELEKEAKEREFADGQRANYINGIWHCSNCGCPDDIAIGRRKGPLGDKSQCGACGKFWHRHRRPRPVEYHSEREYHLNLIAEAERAKAAARKKGGAAALRALTMAQSQSVDSAATPASDDPSSPPPPTKQEMWVEIPTKKHASQERDDKDDNPIDRPVSPASSLSSASASELPLAQMVGMNGSSASKPPSTVVTPMRGPTELPPDGPAGEEGTTTTNAPTPSASVGPEGSPQVAPVSRPQWLEDAIQRIKENYPEDIIEVVYRRLNNVDPPLWKIKCIDCPGKLYNSGPDQTLNNFDLHLKNRGHRAKVAARIASSTQKTHMNGDGSVEA